MSSEHDWSKNENHIVTDGWSCRASEKLYRLHWPDDPEARCRYETGRQCVSCVHYAPFNTDWGLCCNAKSQHHLETVFEHFTCNAQAESHRATEP